MTDQLSPASAFAEAFVDECIALGIQHAVVSPGSRSQAVALALAERDDPQLHVRIDERVASFTALGLGRESGMPAVVVCTSGTAVGNMLPAVMEASHAGVPLIVLSCDRPSELRGTGANQTTWQPDIFGRFVREAWDVDAPAGADSDTQRARDLADLAVGAALGRTGTDGPGPVHINLQLREPLSGFAARAETDPSAVAPEITWTHSVLRPRVSDTVLPELSISSGPRTVIVAGSGAGQEAEQAAHALRVPLLAEVTSGARYGRYVVPHYRALLRDPELGGRIERVIVFGHPTLSREVPALCLRSDVEVVVVTSRDAASDGDAFNPGGRTATFTRQLHLPDTPGVEDDGGWLRDWMLVSRAIVEEAEAGPEHVAASASPSTQARRTYLKGELAYRRESVTREMVARAVWAATWPHDRLVLGSSRMVRVLDSLVTGKKVTVHANRGLAGIDGTVATTLGVALASQRERATGVTRAVLGDLTFLHDVGGLLLGSDEPTPNVQLVVVNDGGGTIFDTLEVATTAQPGAYRRVMRTPQRVKLESLAAAYGWDYTAVTNRSELEQAVLRAVSGLSIVEVRIGDAFDDVDEPTDPQTEVFE